jgi:hypothetical protein
MSNQNVQTTKVVTNMVRFSYAHVFEPHAIEGGDPKYSVSILIPKSDKATIAAIKAATKAAIEAGKAKLAGKNGLVNEAALKLPLRDGDVERSDDDAYAGHYFINATSKNQPSVVDAAVRPIMNQSDFYSGCYGRASVNLYAFNVNGNKGIACGLNNLQKLKDGEALSGGSKPEEDFTAVALDDDDDDLLG